MRVERWSSGRSELMEGVLSRLSAIVDRGEASGQEVVGTRSEAQHVRAWWDAIGTTTVAQGQALADGHALAAVAEPPNLMPPKSTCLPLETKYSRDGTKLRSSIEHTPGENPKIHIFPPGSQMRE